MNNLLNFISKHYHWAIFIIYLIMSLVMLFNNNPYQQSVYLTSANSVTATVYEGMSAVTGYIHLKDINEDLQERNALLEMEIIKLRSQLNEYKIQLPDTTLQPRLQQFDFIVAHVISNSIAQPNNYITINRGSNDGIKAEMGVVDQNGIVGVVDVTGPHSARIISLLNPDLKLSCKLKNSEYFGAMIWDGVSPEYGILEQLPKHMKFAVGDTIVTSGYSSTFPEGIIVGTVTGRARNMTDNFVSLKVKLTTNFSQLGTVRVISNNMREELKALEQNSIQGDGKEAKK